jgi:hypothetical protein
MSLWRVKSYAIRKAVFDRNVVPPENFKRTQMVDNRKGIKLVQARDYTAVFNIGQAANVEN